LILSALRQSVRLLEKAGLDEKARSLLKVMRRNPYESPCEKLKHDLEGCFSRCIKHQRKAELQQLSSITDNIRR
jgi:Txe/YoeB family toxin of Txe-Axe toxin-antitoxin module